MGATNPKDAAQKELLEKNTVFLLIKIQSMVQTVLKTQKLK